MSVLLPANIVYRDGLGRPLTSAEGDSNLLWLYTYKVKYEADNGINLAGPLNGQVGFNFLKNSSGLNGNLGWTGGNFVASDKSLGFPYFYNVAAITSGSGVFDTSDPIATVAGQSLTLSSEINVASMTAGYAYLTAEAFNSSLVSLGVFLNTTQNAAGNSIAFVEGTGITPSGTAFVKVNRAIAGNPRGPVASIIFRRIKLETGSRRTIWTDETSVNYADSLSLKSAGVQSVTGLKTFAAGTLKQTTSVISTKDLPLLKYGGSWQGNTGNFTGQISDNLSPVKPTGTTGAVRLNLSAALPGFSVAATQVTVTVIGGQKIAWYISDGGDGTYFIIQLVDSGTGAAVDALIQVSLNYK